MVERELRDDPRRDLHQPGSSSVSKNIASPARIASRVFGWPSSDPAALRDPVDRPLAAAGELHHEQLRPASPASSSTASSSRSASATPGRFVSSCSRRSADGGEDAEAARARGEDRLEADVLAPGSRARRRRCDRLGRPATRRKSGAGTPMRSQQRVALGLVVRAADRVGRRDEDGEPVEGSSRPARPAQVERRLRQHRVDALVLGRPRASRPRTRGPTPPARGGRRRRAGADRALGHVRPDQAHRPLAVLAQRAQQRRRPGAPEAETRIVACFTRGRSCQLRAGRGAGPAPRRASRASSRASSRPGRPRSPGA